MPQSNLTIEEHQSLTKFVSSAYSNNYRNNLMDKDTFIQCPIKFMTK